ncbi:PD40 domain-containing protein [Marinicella sediminis]|uniref:PD40 domain-containing protein n=1 Tax=Marinicella sediminis TaxID=1792834 RepID=A0ABV7J822_9GAMM|nr:PD40 domain-containing protein [Marinicella sediminis]
MKTVLTWILSLLTGLAASAEVAFDWPGVHVRDYALRNDHQELYVTMENVAKDSSVIVRLEHHNGQWSQPEVASFSGQFKDLEAFLHPNGLQLFFASNRNLQQDGVSEQFDLWVVSRQSLSLPWQKPVRLPAEINTEQGNEFYPSVTAQGHLYFTASRDNAPGKEDIFVSRLNNGVYQPAVPLPDAINTATYEFNAFISPDEQWLFFSSFGRADDHGGGDLYVSQQVAGQWQPAQNLGNTINSEQLDYCPFYDAASGQLYWTSGRSDKAVLANKLTLSEWMEWVNTGSNGWHKVYHIDWPPAGQSWPADD